MPDVLLRALAWSGVAPSPDLLARFDLFAEWLRSEGVLAGGIGPSESERLEARHLADSVLFQGASRADGDVIDVGSGVGLPGIPLALLRPHRNVTLLDRSGKRVALARRAVRVLGLTNVDVVQADVSEVGLSDFVVVSRAAIPPEQWAGVRERCGSPRELLVGGSHVRRPAVPGFETVDIPPEILDRPVWILRMAP